MKKFKTVCEFGFKENCKTIVCDCDFMIIMTKIYIFFMVIMIKNILKIILKS